MMGQRDPAPLAKRRDGSSERKPAVRDDEVDRNKLCEAKDRVDGSKQVENSNESSGWQVGAVPQEG